MEKREITEGSHVCLPLRFIISNKAGEKVVCRASCVSHVLVGFHGGKCFVLRQPSYTRTAESSEKIGLQ